MSDLEILRKIEEQLNDTFKEIRYLELYSSDEKLVFSKDDSNNIIGLQIIENTISNLSLIGNLSNLIYLSLTKNKINDISQLRDLKKLEALCLDYNNIFDISCISNLEYLDLLSLSNNQIKNIVPLKKLSSIEELNLRNNQIEDISLLENLKHLIYLYLDSNQINNISSLRNLYNLRVLNLSKNQIREISPLEILKKIEYLYLDNNQINDIFCVKSFFKKEKFEFNFENNPLKYPPIEIVELGKEAINEYFDHCEKGTSILREAKLIVIGEAGAGKTTFAKKIQNPNTEMPKPDETTLGIDVFNWNFNTEHKNELNTKIWDFGGQDIYHGTHQFFFSDKSLYVLLADTREQKTDFNYWLNTVEQITGENSPLIIVLNRKQKHYFQIDEPGLRSRFGSIIRRIIDIDLSDVHEIPNLQNIIQQEILNLPQIGYILPTSWVEIRQKLSKLNDKFISFSTFRDICKDTGITNPKVVKIISTLFTNIGVFTHFSDNFSSLHDIIFLDSDWLTKTVYLLLNNEIVRTKQGRINLGEISKIWKTDDVYFEKNKFIELLKKFSLIYRINGSNNFIVPEYISMVQPYQQWKYANEVNIYQFRFLFDNFMPKAIMPKLIVALHQYIYDNNLVWHRGVNITNSPTSPDTYAEIIETYGRENRFDIKIYGKNQKDLLNVIIHHFDNVLKPFKKLTHEKLVPCNCDTCKSSGNPIFYNYTELKELNDFNINEIRCRQKPFLYAKVNELLNGINFTELRSLLINEKFEEFEKLIYQRFSDISYQIHKEQVSEGYFHSIFHTILAENGLNPVSEESTSDGRIDIHLTIGEAKYLFELKVDKTAEEALSQIQEKEYYLKYQRGFNKIMLIGINFNSKKRNIDGLKTLRIS